MHGLHRMYHVHGNRFGHSRMVLLGSVCQVKLVSVRFEIVLVLRKIGARFAPNVPWARKSLWVHPIILLGNIGQEEACFGPFGDSVNLGIT